MDRGCCFAVADRLHSSDDTGMIFLQDAYFCIASASADIGMDVCRLAGLSFGCIDPFASARYDALMCIENLSPQKHALPPNHGSAGT